MIKVIKVIMYVFRNNKGKKEFFILHRKKGDIVTLTGHVGDFIKDETLEDAAKRETKEELGLDPIKTTDLKICVEVCIEKPEGNIFGEEHAFLIEIPNKDVYFLEANEKHKWYLLEELHKVLTYPNQKEPLDKIKQLI